MLGREVDKILQSRGPLHPWGNTLPLLQKADLTIVNLECVIAAGGRPFERWRKVFHFRAGRYAIDSLKLAGIDCVTLANNHVLDFEVEALLEMLELLENSGIAYTGAGRSLQECRRPALLEARGAKVAVLAFTDNEPGWAATPSTPGTNWIPVTLEEASLEPVRQAILAARASGAELVIFTMHWGPNMVERPPAHFRQFARAVVNLGADVYFGHSAHIFQGIEIFNRRPIIYDAGDFVDDYAVDPYLRNDRGLLFLLHWGAAPAMELEVELVPVRIQDCQTNLAIGRERVAIEQRIQILSAELGTQLIRKGDRFWASCSA